MTGMMFNCLLKCMLDQISRHLMSFLTRDLTGSGFNLINAITVHTLSRLIIHRVALLKLKEEEPL